MSTFNHTLLLNDYWKYFHPTNQCSTTDDKLNKLFAFSGEYLFEIPGCQKDNINIEFEDGYLRVTADYEVFGRNKSFNRTVYCPYEVKTDDIKCEFSNGLLLVKLPKKSTKIEIGV